MSFTPLRVPPSEHTRVSGILSALIVQPTTAIAQLRECWGVYLFPAAPTYWARGPPKGAGEHGLCKGRRMKRLCH